MTNTIKKEEHLQNQIVKYPRMKTFFLIILRTKRRDSRLLMSICEITHKKTSRRPKKIREMTMNNEVFLIVYAKNQLFAFKITEQN